MSNKIDYQNLFVQVKDYIKTGTGVVVVLTATYSGDEKDFISESIPFVEGKKQTYYVQQAFKMLKKSIKDFVKESVKKPSIIGSILSIPGDFAVDEV